jgi:purine-nucleoside/S-methyl-5'-thioadenosine phosphorylase / adenosine deaminase
VRVPEPFEADGEHLAIDLPGARALFTTRRGGRSQGPYESLNLGRWTDDDPAAVEHNREALQRRLDVRFAYGRQVHGVRVSTVSEAPDGRHLPDQADGQATSVPGLAPMVLTADCLPIAIAGNGGVAMLHAGWRGLAAGVVKEGVKAVRELGVSGPLEAAIGPGAGPCCYEVSEDVLGAFEGYGEESHRGRNLDLKAIARIALEREGVQRVHDAQICTICTEAFFSHRRDRGVTGRQAGIAWLT